MRVLLISPPFRYRGRDGFPLGLGYLAAVARDMADVAVLDAAALRLSQQQIAREIEAQSPDIVGITQLRPRFRPRSRSLGPRRQPAQPLS